MKFYCLFIILLMTIPVIAMENKNATQEAAPKKFGEIFKKFGQQAKEQLSQQDDQALGMESYQENREAGIEALRKFAHNLVSLGYSDKPLSKEKIDSKTDKFLNHLTKLRDGTAGFASVNVTDEVSARAAAFGSLSQEEKLYLINKEHYSGQREKALAVIQKFAQLTVKQLETHQLLEVSQEEYTQQFIEAKVNYFDEKYLSH